ncbi:TPA: molecular chaperone [Vibrio cholerae]|nr:molecular chaperone [Vibrio cholerae]
MLINNSIYSSQTIFNSNRHEVSEDYHNNDHEINQLLESPPSLKNNVKLREAVAETATSNKEQEIADSLLGAIDDHTIQLEAISNWTEGGLSAFKGALEMIAQNMLNNPPKNGEYGSYYEDLFQLVLMDVLANAEDYGFSQDQKFMQFLAWGLEYIGTGQHSSWVENLPDPDTISNGTKPGSNDYDGNKKNHLAKIADYLWKSIASKVGDEIPGTSLASRLMEYLSRDESNSVGISSSLPNKLSETLKTGDGNNAVSSETGYYDADNGGGWITNRNNNMSPMMRLVLLSNILYELEELSTSDLNTILYGDLKSINECYKKLFKVSSDTATSQSSHLEKPHPDNVYQYIIQFDNDDDSVHKPSTREPLPQDDHGWQDSSLNHVTTTRPSSATISLDFAGDLDRNWLDKLSQNYPKRILGDEDIKEINRLGDSVKMIMQTLKYWFQIMRDERVAIARNI